MNKLEELQTRATTGACELTIGQGIGGIVLLEMIFSGNQELNPTRLGVIAAALALECDGARRIISNFRVIDELEQEKGQSLP